MTKNHFFSETKCFCEGKLYNKEYVNTITALVISFFGFYGINKNNANNINLLYSLIFSNGISSSLNHYYNLEGFSYLDKITMILPINLGNLYIYEFYLKKLSKWENIYKLFYLLFPSTLYLTLVIDNFTKYFDYIFLFLALLLIGFIPLINNYGNKYGFDKCIKKIRNNFIKGALFVIVGAGLWWYSEPKCKNPKVPEKVKKKLAKLHLHGIWHILAGYGFYLIIHSINMIKLYDIDKSDKNKERILNSFKKTIPKI